MKRRVISRNQRVLEHFNRKIETPKEEVKCLLFDYNNLMNDFNRDKVAEIMIVAFKENLRVELEEMQLKFEEL